MFTSLRTRLWLSYALLITTALSIVVIVLFAFLLRNPVLLRQTQQQLRAAQGLITADPQSFIDQPNSLESVTQAYNVRVLLFDANRQQTFDTNPTDAQLPFPAQKFPESKFTSGNG